MPRVQLTEDRRDEILQAALDVAGGTRVRGNDGGRRPEEARTVVQLSGTADAREGLAAVIERRKPTFTGR